MASSWHVLAALLISVTFLPCRSGAFADSPASQPATNDWFRESKPLFDVRELSVELGLDVYGSKRDVRTDPPPLSLSGYRQKNKSFRVDETVALRSDGSIAGDEVLRYDLYLRGGLSQERFSESRPFRDLSREPDGHLLEYDLRLQALGAGKISATGFASQLESRIPRPFLPSLDRIRSRHGAGLTYNDAKLPMSLTWESIEDRINSRYSSLYQDREDRQEDRLTYEATWHATEDHTLSLEYTYENRGDQYSGTVSRFETQRNLLSINDTIQFGEEQRHRLETLLRMEDEQGDLARDVFELSPSLQLRHTDDLFSNYRAQYLKENYWRTQSETFRGDAGLTHLFKDILTSTINIYGLQQNADRNADLTEWGSIASLNASKEHSIGRLTGNLSYLHSMTRSDGGRREGVVINEAVTFRDPLPAILAHSDVNTFTVIVTAPNRIQVYLPGRDYIVVRVGRYTAIHRIPTGMILDRQTVLVSYTYRVFNDYELNRDRVDLRIQEDLKMGLSPYYAASLQDEEIAHDNFLTWRERDIRRHRVGATYRQANWSIGPEYEYNNDSIDPYQAAHLNGDLVIFRNARHQLSGRGTASRSFFDGRDFFIRERNTTLLDLGLNYRYALAQRLEASADVMYRYETDSIFGRTQGVDVRGSLAYRIGLFSILFEIEYDSLDLPSSSDDSVTFWVKVRREFPVIGEGRRR